MNLELCDELGAPQGPRGVAVSLTPYAVQTIGTGARATEGGERSGESGTADGEESHGRGLNKPATQAKVSSVSKVSK